MLLLYTYPDLCPYVDALDSRYIRSELSAAPQECKNKQHSFVDLLELTSSIFFTLSVFNVSLLLWEPSDGRILTLPSTTLRIKENCDTGRSTITRLTVHLKDQSHCGCDRYSRVSYMA
jgi:hypothetical protein